MILYESDMDHAPSRLLQYNSDKGCFGQGLSLLGEKSEAIAMYGFRDKAVGSFRVGQLQSTVGTNFRSDTHLV